MNRHHVSHDLVAIFDEHAHQAGVPRVLAARASICNFAKKHGGSWGFRVGMLPLIQI